MLNVFLVNGCRKAVPSPGLPGVQPVAMDGYGVSALQIQRPLAKADFAKLVQKTLGLKLAPAVQDIVFAVFGDSDGMLDGPAFVQVMKSRNRVGYRVSTGCWLAWRWSEQHAMPACCPVCSNCRHLNCLQESSHIRNILMFEYSTMQNTVSNASCALLPAEQPCRAGQT